MKMRRFSFCMRGSERTPLETILHGTVLISNDCQSAQDTFDFPIPKRNIVTESTIGEAIDRILNNFEDEQAEYEGIRSLYKGIGPKSMAKIHAVHVQS
jgi:hypothetical protein